MDRPPSYDRLSVALHWLMALMIFGLYAMGLAVDLFDKPQRPFIINLHAAIGLVLVVLLALRLSWRATRDKPPYPPGVGPLSRKIAAAGHGVIYLLIALIPALGLRAFFLRGRPLDLGFLQIPSPWDADRHMAHEMTELHGLLAHVLIAVVVLHALVALWHQFVLRDNLLARMRPR
jgi:cytochrome b561